MKKVIIVDGMHCAHCQATVEKTLNGIEGVQAKVSLSKREAVVTLSREVPDQVFRDVLSEEGFQVVSIEEKKGLFGG